MGVRQIGELFGGTVPLNDTSVGTGTQSEFDQRVLVCHDDKDGCPFGHY